MYTRILIPLDGSVCGEHALREGLKLAKKLRADVTLLHVLHPEQSVYTRRESGVFDVRQIERATEEARAMLMQAAQTVQGQGVGVETVLIDDLGTHPVEAILRAEQDHDLTVLATHGRRGLKHFFLGSVTEAVLRRSQQAHLVVGSKVVVGKQKRE